MAAISVIIVSELGDKTFFIAAIMAMRYHRLTVMAGAMLALGLMTCLSVLFGYATTVIPRVYTYYVSTALFAIFGIRMLREGLKMSPDEGQEELEEVQAELKRKDEEFQRAKLLNGPDLEAGAGAAVPPKKWLHFISPSSCRRSRSPSWPSGAIAPSSPPSCWPRARTPTAWRWAARWATACAPAWR